MPIQNESNTYLMDEREILEQCVIKNIEHNHFPPFTRHAIGMVSKTSFDLYNSNELIGKVSVYNFIKSRTMIYTWLVKGNLVHSVEQYFSEELKR